MLVDLEGWVLRESCKQVAQWQQPNRDPLMLNVNLCPKHYTIPDLAEDLSDILQNSGLDPHLLGLEITESAIMENTDTVTRTLSQIKKLGIQFHMDDFGTGYSSLSYLHRFPIDSLKICRQPGPEQRNLEDSPGYRKPGKKSGQEVDCRGNREYNAIANASNVQM